MSLLEQIQTLIGSVEDRQSFLQRIRQLVSPTDLQRIEAMQGLLLETGGVLEQYQRRNGKLRRALFGAKTEKTAKVGSVANPPLARTKPKRKGHGRRGAAQYTGARRVEVCHPSLKAWQVCGKCIQRPSGQAIRRRRGESVGPQIHQVGRMAGRIRLQFRDRAKNLENMHFLKGDEGHDLAGLASSTIAPGCADQGSQLCVSGRVTTSTSKSNSYQFLSI